MGISSRRIRYGIGSNASISGIALDEGIPLLSHVELEPVQDSGGGYATASPLPGIDAAGFRNGTQYYRADLPIAFRQAHAAKLLDNFHGLRPTPIGPAYTRNYTPSLISYEPASFLSFWKRTTKPAVDENVVGSGGVVFAWSISYVEGEFLKMNFPVAFARRVLNQGGISEAQWEPLYTGESGLNVASGALVYVGGVQYGARAFSFQASTGFAPNFYAAQEPERIVRTPDLQFSGSLELRDKTTEVRTFYELVKNSTRRQILLVSGDSVLIINAVFHSGLAAEDERTRGGTFNFTAVRDDTASPTTEPYYFAVSPDRIV